MDLEFQAVSRHGKGKNRPEEVLLRTPQAPSGTPQSNYSLFTHSLVLAKPCISVKRCPFGEFLSTKHNSTWIAVGCLVTVSKLSRQHLFTVRSDFISLFRWVSMALTAVGIPRALEYKRVSGLWKLHSVWVIQGQILNAWLFTREKSSVLLVVCFRITGLVHFEEEFSDKWQL